MDDRDNAIRNQLVLVAPFFTDGLIHQLAGNEAGLVGQDVMQPLGGFLVTHQHRRGLAQQTGDLVVGELDRHRQQHSTDLLNGQQGIDPLVARTHGNPEHLAFAAPHAPFQGAGKAQYVAA